jgi:hypothetical protein
MSAGDIQFNLQQFLADMREEQREDIKTLSDKVDGGFHQLHGRISAVQTKVNDHETRVTVVEKTHKLVGWLAGAAIVAILGAAATYIFTIVPRLFATVKP